MFSCGCYFVSVASLSTPNSACDDDEIRSTKFDTYWYRDHHWGWVWKDLHFFIYKHTLHNAMPHHTTPHHTTSHHITPNHTTPHHITSHHTTATPQPPATPCHTTQRNISSACCDKYNTGDKNKQSFLCRQFLNLKYHILAENTIPAPMNFGGRIDRGKANIQF